MPNPVDKLVVDRKRIPEMALTLMLVGILAPTAMYSFRLSSPTPADLLVAVSIALFSAVLFLWILDATNLMPFRAAWISKAVYGAAITSILGTSVAVYKDFFYADKYPFEGAWQVSIEKADDPTHPTETILLLSYSRSAGRYWGYSNLLENASNPKDLVWLEAIDISPASHRARIRLHFHDGSQQVLEWKISTDNKDTFINSSEASSQLTIEMRRPA